jgi:hypothetical protein
MAPGLLGPDSNSTSWWGNPNLFNEPSLGLLPFLAVYMEEGNIQKEFATRRCMDYSRSCVDATPAELSAGQFRFWSSNPNSCWPFAQYVMGPLMCPSDGPYTNQQGEILYYASWEPNVVSMLIFSSRTEVGRTNYVGCSGWLGAHIDNGYFAQGKGIFGNRVVTKMGQITDGTSQTLMLCEVLGTFTEKKNKVGRLRSVSWTCGPLFSALMDQFYDGYGDNAWPWDYRYRSFHDLGNNYCLADGSVQFYTNQMNSATLQNMASRSEGRPIDQLF